MTDQELRGMIRESIARHVGADAEPARETAYVSGTRVPAGAYGAHASHARLALVTGGDENGACLIEPAVRCNHCGYCQSQGY
jgi:hypothetical protein